MAVPIPIDRADLEFDNGSFDSYGFAAEALSSRAALAAVIDHTLLKPEATRVEIVNLCDQAIEYRFACVMVNPMWAATAVARLSGSGIPVGVAIGSTLGASLVSTLRHEAAALARLGVREMDMVMPIGQLKSGNHHAVQHTIHAAAVVAHHHGAVLKVILETALLSMEEKLRGDRDPGRHGLYQDVLGVCLNRRDSGGRGADTRSSGRPLRRKSLRRHPHTGRRKGHAGSGSKPDWLLGFSRDCAGTGERQGLATPASKDRSPGTPAGNRE